MIRRTFLKHQLSIGMEFTILRINVTGDGIGRANRRTYGLSRTRQRVRACGRAVIWGP